MPMALSVWAGEPAGARLSLRLARDCPSLARAWLGFASPASGLRAVAKRPARAGLGGVELARAAPRRPLKARGGKTRSAAARFASIRAGLGRDRRRKGPLRAFQAGFGVQGCWVRLALACGGIGPKAAARRASGSAQIAPPGSFLRVGVAHSCAGMLWRLARLCGGASCAALDSPRRRAADGLTRRVGADSRWLENGGAQRFRRSMAAASRRRLSALSSPSRAWIASWVACLAFSQAPSAPSSVA